MAKPVEFVIRAKDRFSKTFTKLRTTLPSVRSMALASGASFAAMGATLAKVTQIGASFEQSIKTAGGVMRATGAMSAAGIDRYRITGSQQVTTHGCTHNAQTNPADF